MRPLRFSGAHIANLPPGTRIRTPSGRFARIQKYDEEGRVHVSYYDDEGGEGCFPGKLVSTLDVIKPANTHIAPDPRGPSEATVHQLNEIDKEFWGRERKTRYS